ncbi:alpha/beta hydrolase family protein [Ornithinimicrobium sp. Y1847]|uniref:alpha/beta hydrolase n=1 Tax=Ornithinimicrobium sp. Y1847 TaxID=3405419 RepID=UPI003B675E00
MGTPAARRVELRKLLDEGTAFGGLVQSSTELHPGMRLDMLFRQGPPEASQLLVLLPSAQSRATRSNPIFHRWSWERHFPDQHVIALSDPALYLSEQVLGGWFMHPDADLVEAASAVIRRLAASLAVPEDQVVLFGSSMGGFLAMMLAAHVPGASAVAEIPQFDMRRYEFPSTLRAIETHQLNGRSIDEQFALHPAQVSVVERFRRAGHVPSLSVLTNTEDVTFLEAPAVIQELLSHGQLKAHHGELTVSVVPDQPGHTALDHPQVRAALRGALTAAHVRGLGRFTEPPVAAETEAAGHQPLAPQEVFYPGFSSTPDASAQVLRGIVDIKSTVATGHVYINGPMIPWTHRDGELVSTFTHEPQADLQLVMIYYGPDRQKVGHHFIKPGDDQPHTVPSDTAFARAAIRLHTRGETRLRLFRRKS